MQDRTGGTDIIFYPVIQITIMFLTDRKNTGNTDTFSLRQTAGKFQFIRAGVITNDNQPVALHSNVDFNTLFFLSGLLTSVQGIFQQILQKGNQVDLTYL